MNLPHLAPVLFAKELLAQDEKSVKVKCEFPYPPTLPMILEAAAQSSSALSEKSSNEGFLVAANSLKLHKKADSTKLIIEVKEEMQMGNMNIFSFEVKNTAVGKFTIYVK